MQAILDGATIGPSQRAGEDPAVIKGDKQKENEV